MAYEDNLVTAAELPNANPLASGAATLGRPWCATSIDGDATLEWESAGTTILDIQAIGQP